MADPLSHGTLAKLRPLGTLPFQSLHIEESAASCYIVCVPFSDKSAWGFLKDQ